MSVPIDSKLRLDRPMDDLVKGDMYVVLSDGRFLMYGPQSCGRKSSKFGMVLHGEDALKEYISKLPKEVSPNSIQIYQLASTGLVQSDWVRTQFEESHKE